MTDWKPCPICKSPDAHWEIEEDETIITCTNTACRSNGGEVDPEIDRLRAENQAYVAFAKKVEWWQIPDLKPDFKVLKAALTAARELESDHQRIPAPTVEETVAEVVE